MAGKGGFLGNLYYTITGEDRLEEILRKDKELAQEVAKIAGGIKIGGTRITQDAAKNILKEAEALEKAGKAADGFAAAQEKIRSKQAAGEFKEYIQSLTRYSDAQKQMSAYYREMEKEMGTAQTAAGSIKMLEAELKKLKDTYRSLSETDRNSILGKTMLTQINNADENLAKINAEMANNAALAKTMGTQYNGLRTQISMVARELPNLGISLSTFIISLSNNLPYLADEIAKARKELEALRAAGQTATPVWKQMMAAIFNWQTALIVGVTVLTAYSREIQAWVKGLIEGTGAAAELSKTQKILNDLYDNATKNAAKETAQLQLLYGVTQDTTRTIQERTAAAEQLQKLFPDYFGNLNTETILVGNAQRAYELLAVSIRDAAKASILQERYTDLERGRIDVINDRDKAQAKLIKLNKELEKLQKSNDIWNSNAPQIAALAGEIDLYTKKIEKANEEIRSIDESQKQLLENYTPKATPQLDIIFKDMPEVIDFNKTIADLNRSLSLSEITQDEYNKKVNDAKGVLIAAADAAKIGGSAVEQLKDEYIKFNKIQLQKKDKTQFIDTEKQRNEIEKANQALKEAITKAEIDIEQTRINLMEDGSDKTIAQIRLDYRKRNAAIEKESFDYLEKVRKAEREQWEKDNPDFNKKKLQFTSIIDLSNQLNELGNQMKETFGKGNVDLLTRPLIDASELVKRGWEDAGEGIATVFSSSFQLTQGGKDVMVHVTPILPDGSVLSPDELEHYIDTTLNDAENILQSDSKKNGGLGIVLNVDTDLSDKIAEDFGEGLHLAQEKYYDLVQEIKNNPLSIQVEGFQSQQEKKIQQSADLQKKQTDDLTKSLKEKWQNYADQRIAIENNYNKKVEEIEEDREFIGDDIADQALKKAKKDREDALSSLDSEALALMPLWKKIFGDTTELGYKNLVKITEQAKKLIETAKERKDDQGNVIGYVLEDENGKKRNASIEEYNRLIKQTGMIQKGLSKENPFESIVSSLDDYFHAEDRFKNDGFKSAADMKAAALSRIGDAANDIGQVIKGLTDDWANMFAAFGDDATADTLSSIGEIAGQIGTLAQNLASGNPIQQAVGVLSFVPGIITSIANMHDKRLDRAIKKSQLEVQRLQGAYENLERLIDRQLGPITEKQAKDQISNLQRQRDELDKQMQAEKDKKKSDQSAINDYENQIKELDDQIKYFYEDLAGEQFGINIKDWAGQIADALTEAFEKGEDAAEAFDNTVADIMKSVFKNILQIQYVQPAMEKLREYLFGKDGKGGVLGDGVMSQSDMTGLIGELMNFKNVVEDSQKIWDILNEAAEKAGISLLEDETKKKGLSGAIQGVTEDTANVIGSYLNAIRADVSVNRVNLQKLTDGVISPLNEMALAVANLKHLETIAGNTGRNADAADRILDILDTVTRPNSGKKINV